MDYSKIKVELLKSGLPLESMISDSIDSLSSELPKPLLNLGEYFFQRKEAELPSSVDFLVTYDLDIENCDFVQIAFLIECKYRTRGTGWYFVPNPVKDAGMEFFVENFFSKGKCSWKTFPSIAPPLGDKAIPIAGKGIEIYSEGGRNEKSINEGIHQLMFGTSSLLSRAFIKADEAATLKVMDDRGINIGGRSFHSLLCPVLVTTSNIHFLRDINVEKIEESEKLEDICEAESILAYSTPQPPLHVQRYMRENVARDANSTYPLEISSSKLISFLSRYSTFNPSRYYVVDYQKIKDFLRSYISFASSMLIFACKEKTG